jgi:hypothetical protein
MDGSYKDFMKYFPSSKRETFKLANGSTQHIMGSGTVVCGPNISLSSVLHVPSFPINILSISGITNKLNCVSLFFPSWCLFQELGTGRRLGTGRMHDGLYYLDKDISPAIATVLSPSPLNEFLLQHH